MSFGHGGPSGGPAGQPPHDNDPSRQVSSPTPPVPDPAAPQQEPNPRDPARPAPGGHESAQARPGAYGTPQPNPYGAPGTPQHTPNPYADAGQAPQHTPNPYGGAQAPQGSGPHPYGGGPAQQPAQPPYGGPHAQQPAPPPYGGPHAQPAGPNPYLDNPAPQGQPARQPAAPMPPVQLVQSSPARPPADLPPLPSVPSAAAPPTGGPGAPGTGTGTGGGPGSAPGSGPTPDWAALADAAASRTRRKRLLYIGGGVLATLVVGALVATAVVSAGSPSSPDGKNSALPSPESLPKESTAPTPSFSPVAPPPPPDPKEFISSAEKDKAPLSADTLFPGKSLTLEGRSYAKGATNRTTSCAAATQGALGAILNRNGCGQVIRATFSQGGAAVTVGVAVFKTEAEALKAKNEVKDGIASLPGAGVPTFCRNGTICRKTANSYGRYAYFTVAGFTDNKRNVTTNDKPVFVLGDDAAKYAFLRIVERGRTQASAAASNGTLRS